MAYQTPAPDIVSIIDAPPTPVAALGPGRKYAALVHYEMHPPVTTLARPYLALAGVRVDPAIAGRQRTRRLTGLSVLSVTDGAIRPLDLPDGKSVSVPAWAPDGLRFAFTVDESDGIAVWVGDARDATAAPVPGLRVRDVLGGDPTSVGSTVRWTRDGRHLLGLSAPGPVPERPAEPIEPHIEESAGKHSQMATFQDLLSTDADADIFEQLATTVPVRVDPVSGEATTLGPAGLYYYLGDSPDGQHLLVYRLRRPFSFRVPYGVLRPDRRSLGAGRRAGARRRRPPGQRRGAADGRADRAAAGVVRGVQPGQPGLDRGAGRRRPEGRGRAPGPAGAAGRAVHRRASAGRPRAAPLPGLVRHGGGAARC